MASDPRYFTWYELITTDVMGAADFYREVVGWETREASTAKLPYKLFATRETATAGLMELPEEGRRMGARPRWVGYLGVKDVPATVDQIKGLGGAVYVPPTDTNIGLISVVADPCAATFALIDRPHPPAMSGKAGRVGWHELLAADLAKELAFFCQLFGWQRSDDNPLEGYQAFSAGGQVIGGAFRKRPDEPVPFWLFYFNVDDLDVAVERVVAGGGKAFRNELFDDLSVARCVDPQGAAFALQGRRGHAAKVGWRTQWQGFSSRGQLVEPKPRGGSET